jgi:opine dehydrogenase
VEKSVKPSRKTNKKPTWLVIGGGNGGQSLAGHLAIMGFSVRLYDIVPETIETILAQGGIKVDGVVEGFGELNLATTDLAAALDGSDIVMVVAPAVAHRHIARDCAPFLRDGQLIFIHPGSTGGALEFKRIWTDQGVTARVTIAESNSLLYACRCRRPGCATIYGIKQELTVAALPATENTKTLNLLRAAFPQMRTGQNVLETSLGNPNAMMHPAPTLLNTSMIESPHDWLYYYDGITPSIGAYVEAMDRQRLALGESLDVSLTPIRTWYRLAYGARGKTLSEAVKKNPAYADVKGQDTLLTRYILEDIPMGLVPMASLGHLLDVNVDRMETIIKLGEFLTDRDLTSSGRTVENLGLSGMKREDIIRYVKTGEK